MKKFILFWKKDIINKFIVIVSLMLAAGMVAFIMMIVNMPDQKNFREAVSEIFPFIPTVDPNSAVTATPAVTPTDMPFNARPTAVEGGGIIPTLAPTFEVLPGFTPTPELQFTPTPLASAVPSVAVSLNSDCVPKNPSKTGRVVSVLDGNTVKILIDGLIYTVRYIGVAAPEDPTYSEAARLHNADLVFGKDVTLIMDQSDKDARGRLLRYVLAGDTFVNLALIEKGFGSALDTPPDSACYPTFKQAEQSAINAQIGMFKSTPTP